MKKRSILSILLVIVLGAALSAYSKDTAVVEDSLLYVRDHAGENFLVLKVESCSLGSGGELHCAMSAEQNAKPVAAGPRGGFFARLAYPG
jgi:hypothetical protein